MSDSREETKRSLQLVVRVENIFYINYFINHAAVRHLSATSLNSILQRFKTKLL